MDKDIPPDNGGDARVPSPFDAQYNQVDRVDPANGTGNDMSPLLAEVMDQGQRGQGVQIPAGSEVIINGAKMRTGGDGTVVIESAERVIINNHFGTQPPHVARVEANAGYMYDQMPQSGAVVISGDRPYVHQPVWDNGGQIFHGMRRRGQGNQVFVQSDGPVGVSHTVRQGPNTRFENTHVGPGGVVMDNGGGWTADHTIVAADVILNGVIGIKNARHGGNINLGRIIGGGVGPYYGDGGWHRGGPQWGQRGGGDIVVMSDGDMPSVNRTVRQGPNTRFENTRVGQPGYSTPPFVPEQQGPFGGWTGEHTIVALDTILNGVIGIKQADAMNDRRHRVASHGGGNPDFYAQKRAQQLAESRARSSQRYAEAQIRIRGTG